MTEPPSGPSNQRAGLEERLGYNFTNPALLEEALTHASAVSNRRWVRRSNEQLEFLGDRVLGLAVATILHERYGREAVGALARRHSALVRLEALAEIAVKLDLAKELRMSSGEDDAGGRTKPGLLADACEAIIAAIYLDGGFESAADFVRRAWGPMVDEHPESLKDAKTALQEWTQSQGLSLPVYTLVETSGLAHAPIFSVTVTVSGVDPVAGNGPSKRKAEQAAAERMLQQLRGGTPDDPTE